MSSGDSIMGLPSVSDLVPSLGCAVAPGTPHCFGTVEIPQSVVGPQQRGPAFPAPAHTDGTTGCSRGNVNGVQIKPVTTFQCDGDFLSTVCGFSRCLNHFCAKRKKSYKKNKTKKANTLTLKIKQHNANKPTPCNSAKKRQAINTHTTVDYTQHH